MLLDLNDPALLGRDDVLGDPNPLYDLLRREAPVWQLPGQDTFLVTDPSLIRDVVARPLAFSSNLVSVLHRDAAGALAPHDMVPYGDPMHILATADPPAHSRHRRLLQRHLSPAALDGRTPAIRQIVDEQLAPMLSAGEGDFVTGFGDPIPGRAICDVIGLPQADAPYLVSLVSDIGLLLDGVTDVDGMDRGAASALDLLVYASDQLHAAQERPADERVGLMGVLVDGIDTGEITRDEAQNLLVLLVNAGTETTSSLLATAVRTLARAPELQDALRADPARIADAIEDFLRQEGPFQFHYRWTPADTAIGGTPIPANSRVLLMWAAADRPSPDEVEDQPSDPDARERAPHFAFGRGVHFCIGAHLARLEARIALERLLAQTCEFSLDPDHPVVRRSSLSLRRYVSLPTKVVAKG
jgi:cytochrome P450